VLARCVDAPFAARRRVEHFLDRIGGIRHDEDDEQGGSEPHIRTACAGSRGGAAVDDFLRS
jgi:hypothetical protein